MGTPCKKNCGNLNVAHNGHDKYGKQLFKCKTCGASFVLGDKRGKLSREEKYLILLLKGKLSYLQIARLFQVSKSAIGKIVNEKEPAEEGRNVEKLLFRGEQLIRILEKDESLSVEKSDWFFLKIPYIEGEIFILKRLPKGLAIGRYDEKGFRKPLSRSQLAKYRNLF